MLEDILVKEGPLFKKTPLYTQNEVVGTKAVRTHVLGMSTVEISNGKIFDADEAAQTRMHRALKVAEITGETTVAWKLADNTFSDVTKEELEEAFVLAAKQQSELWLNFG
jgi:hypothetical protein